LTAPKGLSHNLEVETTELSRNLPPRTQPLPSFEQLRHVHVIGVCGTLMGAFAAFMKRRGVRVTGSDENVYPPMSDVLGQAGVELLSGYRAENLKGLGARPDMVVIGNVIGPANPEAKEAILGGYAYCSLPEAMEQLLLKETRNLVVAGTHGKTTTSSILAHALAQCGQEPSFFIGGVSRDLPESFRVSSRRQGGYFVLEGDEYDTAFWDKVPKFNHYLPDDVILTSVEFDHADIYPDFAAVRRAFEGLMDRIRPGGRLIACADYEAIPGIARRFRGEVSWYGSAGAPGARYTPGRVRCEGGLTRFEVLEDGKAIDELALRIPGNHNVLNALAVWLECRQLGLPAAEVRRAFELFQGVKRRQEERGEAGGVKVIDDFAHHPTAVRETLRGLRAKYPGRRLIAVFEPRSATSRRKVFQKDYARAFGEADGVFIAPAYDQSRISAEEQFSSAELVKDLTDAGKAAHLMGTVEEGVDQVRAHCRTGDLVAVLSNGGFGGFIPKLLAALAR
jgi:UDP-N-acetylmuramate: L-alanyl-gamma-D-glutamyl-meso-diaminopimelate ligase